MRLRREDEAGHLSLTASLVEQNHQIGVLVAGSEATIVSTAVRATKRAPADEDFSDGILVVEYQGPSRAVVAATESTDNARAGVIYMDASGELSGVRSWGNRYGLVLQTETTEAQPALGEGNVFEGNTEQDRLLAGDLLVPDAAAPLP